MNILMHMRPLDRCLIATGFLLVIAGSKVATEVGDAQSLGTAPAAIEPVAAWGNEVLFRSEDSKAVFLSRVGKTPEALVFRSANGRIAAVRGGPNGLIAVIETVQDAAGRKSPLHIIDRSGNVLRSFADVREVCWRPSGSSEFAYITMDVRSQGEFKPTGVYAASMQATAPTYVASRAQHINWSSADQKLYIWDSDGTNWTVRAWDPVTLRISETAFKSVYFSSDGKYYHNYPGTLERPFEIYRAADNRPVVSFPIMQMQPTGLAKWSPSGSRLLLGARTKTGELTTFLIDAESGAVSDLRRTNVVGWAQSGSQIVIFTDQATQLLSIQ